jgi:hypothetical protein
VLKQKNCTSQEQNACDREYKLTEKKILNNTVIGLVNNLKKKATSVKLNSTYKILCNSDLLNYRRP